jgi:hypothetical protein
MSKLSNVANLHVELYLTPGRQAGKGDWVSAHGDVEYVHIELYLTPGR